MRTLTANDICCVSGGGNSETFLGYCYYSALNFGANGVLFNVLLHGATLPVVGYGFACGAVIGVLYTTIALTVVPNPF